LKRTLRRWSATPRRQTGERPALASNERARLKALEREVVELKRANEMPKRRAAFERRTTQAA